MSMLLQGSAVDQSQDPGSIKLLFKLNIKSLIVSSPATSTQHSNKRQLHTDSVQLVSPQCVHDTNWIGKYTFNCNTVPSTNLDYYLVKLCLGAGLALYSMTPVHLATDSPSV